MVAAAALALVGISSGSAQALGPQVSVNIVEPKDQSKWGYAPTTRRVAPGTWVTWSNNGLDEHTVTALDGSFDSDTLEPSEGFSWFFDQPGTSYAYMCTLHPWMKGTIVVTGQPVPVSPPPVQDAGPTAPDDTTPQDAPAGAAGP